MNAGMWTGLFIAGLAMLALYFAMTSNVAGSVATGGIAGLLAAALLLAVALIVFCVSWVVS